MTVSRDFNLDGFYRENKGEDGAVFLRYSEDKDERTAEIRKTPMYYGGADTENYILSVPKPRGKTVDACVAVVRTSKNNYIVTAFDRTGLITFKSESLNDVAERCTEFFQ